MDLDNSQYLSCYSNLSDKNEVYEKEIHSVKKNILLVDDELYIRELIADFLLRENYNIFEADNGSAALDILSKERIDLTILDIMIPEPDGLIVCKEIRKNSDIPIIMLTAKELEVDQLYAFEIGADEYITKPFSPKVLTARVNALFRRTRKAKISLNDGLTIDLKARQVFINQQLIELSPKEYELLIYLTDNMGNALSRQQILDHIWNYDYFGDLRAADTNINRLRGKLGEKGNLIQTIRGYGYRFEAEK